MAFISSMRTGMHPEAAHPDPFYAWSHAHEYLLNPCDIRLKVGWNTVTHEIVLVPAPHLDWDMRTPQIQCSAEISQISVGLAPHQYSDILEGVVDDWMTG
ncbi:hypothetical protein PAPYR_8398 [Paratrimastix pyriformis]|uniref:Uncharacterized protein n=1 Tax=Paratrimastix pyriformis TaxID=342808 RepID=A0ABQ8UAN7_9EUKA|nr:hypothetical protein PAPYR_8398 [Paratrimastix pyriformis]